MKKIIAILLSSAFFLPLAAAFAADWQELSGDHFIIYYTGDEKFAKDVARAAEDYYRDIAVGIGYPRYSEFWTWGKRAKIYIYPDHESYVKSADMPAWSHGMANYGKREIVSYMWSEMFIDSILPHEMAHLIFRDFVGFKGQIPLWLDEGVAQWAEIKKRKEIAMAAKQFYEEDKLLTINDLMTLNITQYKDTNGIHIRPSITKDGSAATLILDTNALISTYYLMAVSLIDFLITRYGSDRFAEFCRQLRDAKTVDEALLFAYPANIRNLADLEKGWRTYLAEK